MLDITNQAEQHWNSISSTRHVLSASTFKKHGALLCTIDEYCIPASINSDEMTEVADNNNTMCN